MVARFAAVRLTGLVPAAVFDAASIAVRRTGVVPDDSSTAVRGRLEAVVCIDDGSPPLRGV